VIRLPAALTRLLATPAGRIARRVVVGALIAAAITLGNQVLGLGLLGAQAADWGAWRTALAAAESAGVTAAAAAVQGLLSQWLTGTPRLLPLLALATARGRCGNVGPATRRHAARLGAQPAGLPRFGKAPAAPLTASVRLEPHLPPLPTPPASLNWTDRLRIAWGMMLNDRLGDCTCAAVGHAIQLMTGLAKAAAVTVPDATILALYEAVSGYDPATGANDNGAVEADVLARWRRCGVPGHRHHKIAAYGRVNHRNVTLVQQVIALFGFAYIGTQVPADWEQAPAVWDVSDSQIVGGHAVILVGWDDTGFWLISWGQVFKLTYAAFDRYVDEVWGVVSRDWIRSDRVAPSGLNLAGLEADLQAAEAAS
jgi:hypothetical protein